MNQSENWLESALQSWRESLLERPGLKSDDLAELESHLRDSIAALQSRGLSEAEAFWIATRRLGAGPSLASEFGKVNQGPVWRDRGLWMLVGIQVWGLVAGLSSSLSTSAVSLGLMGARFDFASHGLIIPSSLLAVVHLLSLGVSLYGCWWLVVRKGPGLVRMFDQSIQRRARLVLLGLGLVGASLAASMFRATSWVWVARACNPETLARLSQSVSAANLVLWAVQTLGLLSLTIMLARRRWPARRDTRTA